MSLYPNLYEGKGGKETGKDDVFRKRHPRRVSTREERRLVDGEGDPTDAIPEEAKAAWGFRPQPHARRSTMGEMLVPLTSNEFVSPRSDRSYFGVKLDRVALQGDTFVPLLFFSDLHAERRTEFP